MIANILFKRQARLRRPARQRPRFGREAAPLGAAFARPSVKSSATPAPGNKTATMCPPVPSAALSEGLRKNDSETVPTAFVAQAGKRTEAGRAATVTATFRACARRAAGFGIAAPSIADAGARGAGDAPERHSSRWDYFSRTFTQRSQRARHSAYFTNINSLNPYEQPCV